ncbi:MAG TPA: NAD(P)-dependent oxidoreductase [Dehalococcoidia bacterium]|nr:NAD(P)-dependent oxidoreductase [Dehalococcoidia bacterium]
MSERVGFIGLGHMGGPMAQRLLDAGHRLAVRDVNAAALAPFAGRADVAVCASPRAVAEESAVVFASLPTPAVLEQVATGAEGVAVASGFHGCLIDLSTTGVTVSRRVAAALAARGIGFLDAPVSGGIRGAEEGTLAVMVAGDAALYEAYRDLLGVIGKNVFYLGAEPGMGQAMKLVNNILSSMALAASCEALAVAAKAGIDPALAVDVLNAGSGRNSATLGQIPRQVLTGRFEGGFLTRLMLKDVKLFEELAESLGVPTIVCAANVNAWRHAVAEGYGDEDFTHIATLMERRAGVTLQSASAAQTG